MTWLKRLFGKPPEPNSEQCGAVALGADAGALIASELGVAVPDRYAALLREYPLSREDCALIRSPAEIIDLTKQQRAGFGGAPPWPEVWLYIGDDDDACPTALNVATGRVLKTDHGNLEREELDAWDTLEDYVADLLYMLGEDSDPDDAQ